MNQNSISRDSNLMGGGYGRDLDVLKSSLEDENVRLVWAPPLFSVTNREKRLEIQGASVLRCCDAASLCGTEQAGADRMCLGREPFILSPPHRSFLSTTQFCAGPQRSQDSLWQRSVENSPIPVQSAGRTDTMEPGLEPLPCPDGVTHTLFHKV